MDKYLAVVFICDEKYYIPTSVAILSLLDNREKTNYKIYVICMEMSEESKNLFRIIGEKYNSDIITVDVTKDYLTKFGNLKEQDCAASLSALIKFDISDLLSDEDKVLYLDGDIVVQKDLDYLSGLSFEEDEYVKAVADTSLLYSHLVDKNDLSYFNSGVMLLNLKAMRKDNISEILVNKKISNTETAFMDQDIFNDVMRDHKSILPYYYNVSNSLFRLKHLWKIKLPQVNETFNTEFSEWNDIFHKSYILHYASYDKPWKFSDIEGCDIWDSYYNRLPFEHPTLKRRKLRLDKIAKFSFTSKVNYGGIIYWELKTKGIAKTFKAGKRFIQKKIKK